MNRRNFSARLAGVPLALLAWPHGSRAQGVAALSEADASQGIKVALEAGAAAAVQLLGRPDGFLSNPKVRIPLPGYLKDAAKLMSAMGQKRQVEELETAMNRAAEAAVPLASKLLSDAVKAMTVTDARNILTGGDTSVTQFFATKTREPLAAAFLPTVKEATAKVGLAARYDALAGKGVGLGLVKKEDASIDHYVTRKALDGLYLVIGEEEKKLRQNPLGSGNALLGKVFGALR